MTKPILIVKVPAEHFIDHKERFETVRKKIIDIVEGWIVLMIISAAVDDITFEPIRLTDADEINIEELQSKIFELNESAWHNK